jgi:CheY-like chemotaxis protein
VVWVRSVLGSGRVDPGCRVDQPVRAAILNTATPRPDLILLDLNLPRRDGREVLAEIKADERLQHIPVIVLTTSRADEDVLRSYQLYANAYVSKPVDFDGFIEAIKQIDHFFAGVVQLPTVYAAERSRESREWS